MHPFSPRSALLDPSPNMFPLLPDSLGLSIVFLWAWNWAWHCVYIFVPPLLHVSCLVPSLTLGTLLPEKFRLATLFHVSP